MLDGSEQRLNLIVPRGFDGPRVGLKWRVQWEGATVVATARLRSGQQVEARISREGEREQLVTMRIGELKVVSRYAKQEALGDVDAPRASSGAAASELLSTASSGPL